MEKVVFVLVFLVVLIGLYARLLYERIDKLEDDNKFLVQTMQNNLQAARDKEERNRNELVQLQKQIKELSKVDDECLDRAVSDDLIKFLLQLQQSSDSTISFTFTK